MTDLYKIGDLVIFTDLDDSKHVAVVLADGVSGYGSETKLIYFVYLLTVSESVIAYDWELEVLPKF